MTVRTFLALALAVAVAACSTTTAKSPTGERLTVVQPADQTVYRGKTDGMDVMVRRYGFSGPVSISLDALPRGVRLSDEHASVPANMAVGHLKLYATTDAELVDSHPVRLTATAPNGLSVSEWFELTVRDNRLSDQ